MRPWQAARWRALLVIYSFLIVFAGVGCDEPTDVDPVSDAGSDAADATWNVPGQQSNCGAVSLVN